jgi:thioesterase-3
MKIYSSFTVRGYHLDIYGHVNNARYLEFLEDARWGYLDGRLDLPGWQRRGVLFPLVNININYRYPASFGDVLDVSVGMGRIGKRSMVMHQEIRLRGRDLVVADADVTFVAVDASTGAALPLEGELLAAAEALGASDA